ncbi:hypothetical protein F6A13_03580 [Acidithiobacillus sp. 'AMD consortium']|uniref:hypothetical protein n=1 Tax=Acidithiobacillus sp. 'AMD consortium' TaxID=2614801 RepID=UPI00124F3C99|nr:hypothetical protein [Acidithiobacillus sp. 'AMD consortium']QFG77817.1 hypothetical protein F6A13_03580 [Acidithiobacillus sp. 'AMD consortium']
MHIKKAIFCIIVAALAAPIPAWAMHKYSAESGQEHRQEQRQEQSNAAKYSQAATTVLLPGLIEVEEGHARLESKRVTALVKKCKVFSSTPLVGSITPWCFPGTGYQLDRLLMLSTLGSMDNQLFFGARTLGYATTNENGGICQRAGKQDPHSKDADSYGQTVAVPSNMVLKTRSGRAILSGPLGIRVTTPQMASVCYLVESRILANAETLLSKTGQTKFTATQAASALFEAGNMQAFQRAMATLSPMFRKQSGNQRFAGDNCVVAIDATHDFHWTCAGVRFDGQNRTAVRGGMTILDPSTVWGRSLNIEVSGSIAHSISSSRFSNSRSAKEVAIR